MAHTTFEIRVAGQVPEDDLRDLGAVMLTAEQVRTVIYGVADEPALHGLLARIRSLGLEIVEVRRLPDLSSLGEPPDASGGATGDVGVEDGHET